MFTPAASMTIDQKKLRQAMVIALAEYRDAVDSSASDEDERLDAAVKAVATFRLYDSCKATRHTVTVADFYTIAERAACDTNLRNEIHRTKDTRD